MSESVKGVSSSDTDGDLASDKEIAGWRIAMIGAAMLCFFLYFVSFCFAWTQKDTEDFYKGWSATGAFIGGILGPVVAFAAFYWLTESVRIQKNELSETRAELSRATEAQNKLVANGQQSVKLSAVTALLNATNTRIELLNDKLTRIEMEIAEQEHVRQLRGEAFFTRNNSVLSPREERDFLKIQRRILEERSAELQMQLEEVLSAVNA